MARSPASVPWRQITYMCVVSPERRNTSLATDNGNGAKGHLFLFLGSFTFARSSSQDQRERGKNEEARGGC